MNLPNLKLRCLLVAAGLGALACNEPRMPAEPGEPEPQTRTYTLGFTDFPHAFSSAAVAAAYDVIARDGDLAVMHFDGGVPWQQALDGTPYPPNVQGELTSKARSIPAGHEVYLAVTPIGFTRDGLAPKWETTTDEPLDPPWDRRTFDHPEVITAFGNHCERMIQNFAPDYFALAIEANMLAYFVPSQWPAFVTLADSVYRRLKRAHPDLPVFITLQANAFHLSPSAQRAAIADILPFSDLIAVSAYPFTDQPDPDLLPADYFAQLANLAPDKPFAIAETAWPAEDVTAPYPTFIPASDSTQLAYMQRLLADCDKLSARFVTWFFTRDYDDLWETHLKSSPIAAIARVWKDTGLYDGAGNPRPALQPWREKLALRRVTP